MGRYTDAERKHLSEALRAKWRDPAYVAVMKARFTPAVRAEMTRIASVRRHSTETKRKISELQRGQPGRHTTPHTEAAKRKMSLARAGKSRRPLSEATKRKIRDAQIGRARPDMREERHPNWKGGLKSRAWQIRMRQRIEYRTWRDAVWARDGYTCQRCPSNDRIVAHHIKSFKAFPESRHELENGITLCRACHVYVHRVKDPLFVHSA